jgi:hypothetical protein
VLVDNEKIRVQGSFREKMFLLVLESTSPPTPAMHGAINLRVLIIRFLCEFYEFFKYLVGSNSGVSPIKRRHSYLKLSIIGDTKMHSGAFCTANAQTP